ncbi:MAG: DUF47 family protein [Patescibacteria group bacterium]
MFHRKAPKIFQFFQDHSKYILEAAELLNQFSRIETIGQNHLEEINQLEEAGDETVKQIGFEIEQNFILPLDKEDLKEWSETQDDVLDCIQRIGVRLEVTNYSHPDYLTKINDLIKEGGQAILTANQLISRGKIASPEFEDAYRKLQAIERQGDIYYQKSLKKIFQTQDPIELIKGKEVFEMLEECLNSFEKLAVLFETIKYKYD